ncbi:MAG: hypothetical protein CL946_03545, partial [Ectothiorhodospiraceae bacterium]|nr:hypothetical protein [Ectothiorhodospiraceae bacterium]
MGEFRIFIVVFFVTRSTLMTEQSDPAKLAQNSRIDEVWEVIADFNLGVPRADLENLDFKDLMQVRINKILLVSSLYDFYTLVEDGQLTEAIFNEFLELNLHYAANIRRVNTGKAALEALAHEDFDLIISTQRLEDMSISAFAQAVRISHPEVPVALLAYHSREFEILHDTGETSGFDGVFVWHGDTKLFLAIIKLFEDKRNAPHDCLELSVRTIILVEDSPAFYSSYLPLIYAELIQQVQELIKEGKSFSDKLLRQRARPKILHATTFEQAMEYYEQYRSTLLGIITDMEYEKDGKIDEHAGLRLIEEVRKEDPELPILIQSATARPEDV